MTVSEIASKLSLKVETAPHKIDREVKGSEVSDQVSAILSKGGAGDIWVTSHNGPAIVSVAMLLDLSGVVVAGGNALERSTRERAGRTCVTLLTTGRQASEVAGELAKLGLSPMTEDT